MVEYSKTNRIPLIAIVGPTASGKTSLAIEIATKYNGEIVSADSMQIYKGMNIATAKPTQEELKKAPHHLIGYVDATQSYSVGLYVEQAKKVIKDIYNRGKMPILAGGTGLYVSTLLNNVMLPTQGENIEVRNELYKRLEAEGVQSLLEELRSFDAQCAEKIEENLNAKRIIRAIEVYKTTGVTFTKHMENSKTEPSPYCDVRIGLKCKDRANLYERINMRVDKMLEEGLLKETQEVLANNCGKTAKMAIGYKELKPYFDGNLTLEEAIENLKRETRRYAKRQLTWFNKDEKINWIETDTLENFEQIVLKAEKIIEETKHKFGSEII